MENTTEHFPSIRKDKMTTQSLPTIILVLVGVIGGGAVWYFLSQKMFHCALWSGFTASVLLLLVIALYVRNIIIIEETKDNLKPKIMVNISPDTDPSLSQYRYPLQEYMLFIYKVLLQISW